MLPQKFSAAATWMTRLPRADITPPAAVEQAAIAIKLTAITAGQERAIAGADDGRLRMQEPYNENRFHFKQRRSLRSFVRAVHRRVTVFTGSRHRDRGSAGRFAAAARVRARAESEEFRPRHQQPVFPAPGRADAGLPRREGRQDADRP